MPLGNRAGRVVRQVLTGGLRNAPGARRLLCFCIAAPALGACSGGQNGDSPASALDARRSIGITQSAIPEDGQWLIPAKDYQSTRFSGLTQITAANVRTLRPAWTFSTGVRRGHEAAPLVVGSTMYVVAPYPNMLFALDLAQGGRLKWTYTPLTQRAAQGVACCDVVNRGAAYSDGKIFYNTLDAQTVAVDAETGKEVWRTRLGDINRGETMTMAPLVVKDKVLVG